MTELELLPRGRIIAAMPQPRCQYADRRTFVPMLGRPLKAAAATRGMLGVLGLTISLLLAPSFASARQAFPANGGIGDAQTKDECPRGWYVIGFKGRVGAWIDQIGLVCGRFNGDNSLATRRELPRRGGTGGGEMEVNCPRGALVTAVRYRMTHGWRQVITVSARCTALAGGATTEISFGNTDNLPRDQGFTMIPQVGKDPVPELSPEICSADDAAVGMQINHGRHVNAAGLICDELVRPAAITANTAGQNEDRPGSDFQKLAIAAAGECEAACARNTTCRAWTWVRPGLQGPSAQCYLKNAVPRAVASNCCTSGVKGR